MLTDRIEETNNQVRLLVSARPTPARAGDAGLSAAERVARVVDPEGSWLEIGAIRGHDRGNGIGTGILTGIGTVENRPVVIVASVPSSTGAFWSAETVDKVIRAQEIALRQRIPIGYLLEGCELTGAVPDGWLPGGYGPSRVVALTTALRRSRVPQIAGRFSTLGMPGLLLAELADQSVPIAETGLATVRVLLAAAPVLPREAPSTRPVRAPIVAAGGVDGLLPADHRRSYDMIAVLRSLLDGGELEEFQPSNAAEMLCGHGWIEGHPVAVIANRRGLIPTRGGPPRVGGIIYTASAAKMGYFIETASRQGIPILFVQDVSGFMLGLEAEHSGIIREGAGLVEAMATARSARITLTINHASGAGYYAMASQGFEPDFTLAWPTGRIGAMEAEAAINAVHGTALARAGGTEAMKASMVAMRATFERELDAGHAAARGHVDAIISPESTRATLSFLLRVTARTAPATVPPSR